MRTKEISYNKNRFRWIVLVFLIIGSISLNSCEDLLDNTEEQDEYFVEEELAIKVAENLLFAPAAEGDTTTLILTAKDFTISKRVEQIRSIRDQEDKVVIYVVNYQNGGFVVLSADKRVEPVLAHSVENVFPMDAEFFNLGLLWWLEDMIEHIAAIKKANEQPDEVVLEAWGAVIDYVIDIEFITLACADGYVERKSLLRSKWGQGCGYNDEVPKNCTDTRYCLKAPVGCVATAMGQVLKYHADNGWHGSYYDEAGVLNLQVGWHNMPLTNAATNPGSRLPDVLKDIGLIVKMNYGCSGSGAKINNTFNGFRNNFKFDNAKRKNMNSNSDYTLLINEIKSNRPVYLEGCDTKERYGLFNLGIRYTDCHAWVAHGYSQLYDCEQGFISGKHKIQMNWGWGGHADGSFLKKDGDFQLVRKMIYDIGSKDYEW